MNPNQRMKELIEELNEASRTYYAENREIMSNLEYDKRYDELEQLEKQTGTVLANSPTVRVGYEAVDELEKENHAVPMLSLDKTKDRETFREFIGERKTILSWKMDGLTIVLTYRNGELYKAVTRGNGVTGEVVTNNARVFRNLPLKIPYQGELVLRGEAVIRYSDFNRINQEMENVDAQYKNPRNLCSGSVRQLNNEITAKRAVYFYAFYLVNAEGVDFKNSHEEQFRWLAGQGFEVVGYRIVTADTLDAAMDWFEKQIRKNDFPSDGLVALYDDIAYGESLGSTAKFPRNSYAFKWKDETRETILREIEWSPSRTGLLNPVAIFDPVELEGSTVSRASVHNVSILREMKLGIGDRISVYKANMIIPQISENETKSDHLEIPSECPVCGGRTEVEDRSGVMLLRCINPDCPAKHMKSFTLFVSRDAMNIEGLSESTLEKMMAKGLIHSYADLYRLSEHRDTLLEMEGFGEKSCQNLLDNIEKSRHTSVSRLIYALGIPGVGTATAKLISRSFQENLPDIRGTDEERLCKIDGIGTVTAADFVRWWQNDKNSREVDELLPFLTFEREFTEDPEELPLSGLTFVITGKLNRFPNRAAMQKRIEALGGKLTGSVSRNTDYLINNDVQSASSKNRKARELGIPILSEDDFIGRFSIDGETVQ